ncbi:MAG: carboxypeptidase regulatory-like domain-containing protein, partial [Bryobacterales bacterium]|nr:carboxypeptidase regulatory-like domain-containing protein [Bryobacterales bacterium]
MLRTIALLPLVVVCLPAQETRGILLGRITDPAGALVPGAQVRAVNTATGVAAAARSNASGNFTLPYLLPGAYTLQAEAQGFKKFLREGLEVRV